MKKQVDYVKKGISDLLELPRDIVLDLPKITVVGNLQLYIENHKGIIEYSTGVIRVNSRAGMLVITGNKLLIKAIAVEEVVITGEIEQIKFLQ